MEKIIEALNKRFETHRIVFWYDEKKEFFEQFENMELSNIEKVHVDDNEFELKYKLVKLNPNDKFLLYFTKKKPLNEDNWLLDLELAHHVFQTDQEAMYLQELGLDYHFKELVAEHIDFFRAKERKEKLKDLLGKGDDHQAIRYKMLAVMFNCENVSLATYIHAHAASYSDENNKFDKELVRFNLKTFYWNEIERKYLYKKEDPSIYDFLLEVFSNNFVLGDKTGLSKDTRLLLLLWKDTIRYREYFGKISYKIASDLDVETNLNTVHIEDIIDDDLFLLCDYKIIHELISLLNSEEITPKKLAQLVKKRENKYWYLQTESLYACLKSASRLINLVRQYSNSKYHSFEEGVIHYAEKTFEIDQLYRQYILNYRKSKQNRVLAQLHSKVEKVYANDWLLNYSNNWQPIIDDLTEWPSHLMNSQYNFFKHSVKPYMDKKQRLFVVVSDAFRYEAGVELNSKLLGENRYDSSIGFMVSALPSYTQLGMAALLPHNKLEIQENSDHVLVDGMPGSGISGRSKILASNSGVRATGINAQEFMKMNSAKEGRDFVKNYDLIYIYHNRIDKTGDDKISEDNVFESIEDEIQFLMDLLKKIANMNGSNMIITSDHGFLYQHSDVAESDFIDVKPEGKKWKENRRFVVGEALNGDSNMKKFNGKSLKLNETADILIPKSVNRLRIKGSGSKFLHGGASLQEIVIPLVKVTKKRQDTTSKVDIDIIKTTDRITTNILAVSFIQTESVGEQVLPRSIRASIIAEDGTLLSDQYRYNFDLTDGSERQREVKHRFLLGPKAGGKYKNQRVKLILEEPVVGTSRWKLYKDYYYTLNISFTNDFDE